MVLVCEAMMLADALDILLFPQVYISSIAPALSLLTALVPSSNSGLLNTSPITSSRSTYCRGMPKGASKKKTSAGDTPYSLIAVLYYTKAFFRGPHKSVR